MSAHVKLPAVVAAGVLVATQLIAAGTGEAVKPVSCKAHMSNYHPHQYSDVYVYVKTKKHAKVTTTAEYKTTNTTHHAKASGSGRANVDYYISDATTGYKVRVNVTVKKHGKTGSCSTWFTPKS